MSDWYVVKNASEIPSPALLVYPDRIEANIRRMIDVAGGTDRLCPHVKTHKMAELVRMKLAAGLGRFKCSTLAEAEMLADCGAPDILLAFPQVGPNTDRLARLAAGFNSLRFSTVADDAGLIQTLSDAAVRHGARLRVLVDIDNGMHRSGIEPGNEAVELYRLIARLPGIEPSGLHVYDGHFRDRELAERRRRAQAALEPVHALVRRLRDEGMEVPRIVVGGSGTFPVHAGNPELECSPGTCVFWDLNYRAKFPELDFEYAALLLSRVVSKPGTGRLCVDLGYKAVSPDNPDPRVEFLNLPGAKVLNHSEEHLALETDLAGRFQVGDVLYGVPYHVCPTVALHREAWAVRGGIAAERWLVKARDRKLNY